MTEKPLLDFKSRNSISALSPRVDFSDIQSFYHQQIDHISQREDSLRTL